MDSNPAPPTTPYPYVRVEEAIKKLGDQITTLGKEKEKLKKPSRPPRGSRKKKA